MNRTVIHVEHGGMYVGKGDKLRWDSKEANVFALTFKEEITYEMLVGRICKKIETNATSTKVKLSYIPLVLKPPKILNILDDDDVDSYVSTLDKNLCRSAVNVELFECQQKGLMGEGSVPEEAPVPEEPPVHEEATVEPAEPVGPAVNEEEAVNEEPAVNNEAENAEEPEEREDTGMDNDVNVNEYIELPSGEVEEGQHIIEKWDDGTGLELFQEFVTKEQVQNLLLRASLKECYNYNLVTSDTWRYVVRCSAPGCKWYLRLSRPQFKLDAIWKIKVYRKMHSCSRAGDKAITNRRNGTPQLVADVIHETFPGVIETPPTKQLVDLVHSKVGVTLSYQTALRGKYLAVSVVRGSPEESYFKLPAYLEELEKVNAGTITRLELDKEERFKYLFIALGPCIRGYKAMRKVICVDATFLKLGGVLVFAMAQDPNKHHYPIEFGVLDGEKDASWEWFFRQFLSVVPDEEELVFISDRNSSLMKAISVVYKEANHSYCVYHLSQNVRGKGPKGCKDEVAEQFRGLAKIYTQVAFDREYADFRRRYPKVATYLDKPGKEVKVEKWARCYFKGSRYNIDTTNIAESMNGVAKKARMYALLPMIDNIVAKISEWFNKHRKEAARVPATHKMVPFVENELHPSCEIGSKLKVNVLNSFAREFSVIGKDGKTYLVNLKNLTCSCKRLDYDKYPCVHAVAAVFTYGKMAEREVDLNFYDLCVEYYRVVNWILAYTNTVYTVPHETHWTTTAETLAKLCIPPKKEKKRGRDKENRFRAAGERPKKKRRTNNKLDRTKNLAYWLDI